MYFKKLELLGFKSFSEKTTLRFEPGITAVVGPNGTGKSNIFDSIRWVLGEQSAKSLRGSEMQDVIFNGTDLKEPLGMAEVTLTFDNEKRFFNIEHPEVSITRRIFRSGESEYLLNKTPVRLKDVLDILLGTGIGAESYSIVAQGKIDLVLSSRPEDRRLVFDEASGITKYKAQKRETIRKLEETEQNLLRVNDIITEVRRQIASLERQVNKARKYKEVFETLRLKEINLSLLQKRELLRQKNELIEQLSALERQEAGLLDTVKGKEAKISNRRTELKTLEDKIMGIKNQILNTENLVIRNNEQIKFNQQNLKELKDAKIHLEGQVGQVKNRLILDEEKLNNVKGEYDTIRQNIDVRSRALLELETQLNQIASFIKISLDNIALAKKNILELVTNVAGAKNEISDFSSQQQVYLARKKRLEIERAKVYEEKAATKISLDNITGELQAVKKTIEEINSKISAIRRDLEKEGLSLNNINSELANLEKQRLTLESHKEFLEKLKTEYEDIGESMNVTIYLDKLPLDKMSGLVVKIKSIEEASLKLFGEAKPIELDTQKIIKRIAQTEEKLSALKSDKQTREVHIQELNKSIFGLERELRSYEIALANKQASYSTTLEQFNKISEEEELIVLELADLQKELSVLDKNIEVSNLRLEELNKEHRHAEDLILQEEKGISKNSKSREEILVAIAQLKTELNGLRNRRVSDESTLKILEDTYQQDKGALINIEKQLKDNEDRQESLDSEIKDCLQEINERQNDIQNQNILLSQEEAKYREICEGTDDVLKKIEADRKELDALKNKLYELQMQNKDIDYKYSSIKERLFASYKVDVETLEDIPQEFTAAMLEQEIARLKEKLDSYGTVNLVAIEEYDELKKRYDFLNQQQNDLLTAKESLHQAILKLNRTTKQMFLETFEKVRVEFRNYFRLLFNGGDAQVFLIDEQDPLESGIEIICRPPGKKLQNVLLLSGGEKSLSAIALIFAIFKVKPSPFCVLDEIDAALDEANVDRFARVLQEFARQSQFIVITHNKRTIANANVMYGITMEQSGISKIVSVKFAKDAAQNDKQSEVLVSA